MNKPTNPETLPHSLEAKSINLTSDERRRFWEKVSIDHESGCWNWTAGKVFGYGCFCIRRKSYRAHRVSWLINYGEIPPDKPYVCHTCDNPSCVNPNHLWLGTNDDNSRDRDRKGRTASGDRHYARTQPHLLARGERHHSRLYPEKIPRGENCTCARLTAEQVVAIRQDYAQGKITQLGLAKKYGVSESNIRSIIIRKTWSHI